MNYEDKDLLPLTNYQKDIWLQQTISGDKSEYNIGLIVSIKDCIDQENLINSLEILTQNHDALRIKLVKRAGEVYQVISPYEGIFLTHEVWKYESEEQVNLKIQQYFKEPFEILENTLVHYKLVNLNKTGWFLLMKYHHILLDGESVYKLYDSLFKLCYNIEGSNGQLKSSYTTLINSENLYIKSDNYIQDKLFWKDYLANEREILFDKAYITQNSIKVNKIELEPKLYNDMQSFCKENDVNTYQLLLAGLIIQYSKLTNKDEMLLGLTIHNRKNRKMKDTIGYCVNEIPTYIKINPKDTIAEFLFKLKTSLFEVYRHGQLATSAILQGKTTDFSVNYQQLSWDIDGYAAKGWNVKTVFNESKDKDLVVNIIEILNTKIILEIQYKGNLFGDERLTTNLISRIDLVIKALLKCQRVHEIPIIAEEEIYKISLWNNTFVYKDENKTVYHWFCEAVREHLTYDAISDYEKSITYEDFMGQVNRIAKGLIDAGIEVGDKIALCLSKRIELISSMLAIWQVGAGYIPIDKHYPKERIQFILEDSKAQYMLVETKADVLEKTKYLMIDDLKNYGAMTQEIRTKADQTAYIIYTSGTTGLPKGVMINQKQLANAITYRKRCFELNPSHKVLQIYSPCFDAFLAATLTSLISGSNLVLPDDAQAKDPVSIKKYITQYEITHIDMVPSFLKVVLSMISSSDAQSLQSVVVGGEKITAEVIEMCHERNSHIEVINEYGPTETTILATLDRNMTSERVKSIGKPIDNTRIYILNEQRNQMPIGMDGEIWIAGVCVSEGYVGRADLNHKYFAKDGFLPNERMYKSGDKGRWTENGVIEYADRLDYQVKIRGYRIELREIEEQLKKMPEIEDAIVIDLGENENKYLCAYYVLREPLSEEKIREFLKNILPHYMIPTYFIKRDKIPLSSNGKKDRKQLPLPYITKKIWEEPITKTEKALEKILSALIKVEHIGRNDDLFELGAHSLTIAMAASEIYKVFQKEISLQFMFKHPTINAIAKAIDKQSCAVCQITKQNKAKYYDLTSVQKRLFFIEKWHPNTTLYNVPLIIDVSNNIIPSRLEKAFCKVIEKNESLRTNFQEVEGICKQSVRDMFAFKLKHIMVKTSFEAVVETLIRPFDLKNDLLIRVALLDNKVEKKLLIELHHIIADGMSTTILLEELEAAYSGIELPEKEFQFHDYVAWEQNLDLKSQEDYWLRMYSQVPPSLNMPLDFQRPKEQSFKGETLRVRMSEELVSELYRFTKENDVTPNMVLISAYSILLSKYTSQEDMVIGIPSLGRSHAGVANMIGMFVQTLPLRMQPLGELTIKAYLKITKNMIINAFENQYYPLENLIRNLGLERDFSRNPLFDTMFVYQPKIESSNSNAFYKGQTEAHNKVSKFDFTMNVQELNEGFEVALEYCTDLYKRETMVRLLKHYDYIVGQIINEEQPTIKAIELSLPEEKQAIKMLNNTKRLYEQTTIVELFEAQVMKTPHFVAVIDKTQALTYEQLNKKANQLAHYLLACGVEKEARVAIKLSRSTGTAIAMLGIMKAGASYVPLDINYPSARIQHILNDSGAKWIIDSSILAKIEGYPTDNPNVRIVPCNLAYVIYTSGTTGMPKGVMIEHRNIVNTLLQERETYNLGEQDSTILLFSPAFDGFVISFFSLIISGGRAVLPSEDEGKDISKIKYYIKKYSTTYMAIVPSLFAVMIEELDNADLVGLKYIKLAGEKTSKEIITSCREKSMQVELINAYGPTETAVEATRLRNMNVENNRSIGIPIANTKIFIVNKYHQLLPKGVMGEIAIAGEGVARGYLGNEELTRCKFVPSPFCVKERMYLTGDMGKWTFDNNIEFLGRTDDQVKIRGFRIEIQEIERQLGKVNHVKEVCVVVSGEKQKYLIAYFTANMQLLAEEIREVLSEILPDYMIPNSFIQLEKMPVTLNGKIDKAKLPSPIQKAMPMCAEPSCKEEYIVLEIWKEVLDVAWIDLEESFFHIGGDSIKSMQVAAKLMKLGYEVEARTIMRYPSIRKLSKQLKPIAKASNIESIEGEIALTPIQKWFLHSQTQKLPHFNQSFILEMKETIDVHMMKETFDVLMEHHDALRMKFYADSKGNWKQYNQGREHKLQDFYVWEVSSKSYECDIRNKVSQYQETLNIEDGRLIRVDIFKGATSDYMSIIIHHLVVDGVSFRIILEDLEEIYNNLLMKKTPNLVKTSSFKAWSKALYDGYKNGFIQDKEKAYWENIVNRINQTETKYRSYEECGTTNVTLDTAPTCDLLKKVNARYQTKVSEILLVALSRAFYKWDGSTVLDMTLEGHGREAVDDTINTTRTVGWFTSAYPVLIEYNENLEIQIKAVKANLNGIVHSGIGYGVLRYLGSLENDLEYTSRVGFNYLGVMDQKGTQTLFEFAEIPSENAIGKNWKGFHAIDINSSVIKDKLNVEIAYASDLYSMDQINVLGGFFLTEIKSIIKHCKMEIQAIPRVYTMADVEPFKEVFYKDCFYHALFPALHAYGISVVPYLYASISSYGYDKKMGGLIAKDLTVVPLDRLINQYGLKTEKVQLKEELIENICLNIAKNNAVMVPVDCCYLSYRKDTYQKKHWSHTILVYGYNRENGTFEVIDHDDVNSQEFKNKTALFKDIEQGYLGYQENFKDAECEIYILRKDYEMKKNYRELVRMQYTEFIQKESRQLVQNIQYLKQYTDDLAILLKEESKDESIWQEILYNLNGIIKSKIAEQYKVNNMLEAEVEYAMISNIVKSWMIIRKKIQRYILTNRNESMAIQKLLEDICKLEKDYISCLINEQKEKEGLKWLS